MTQKALNHIVLRHFSSSTAKSAGKFLRNVTLSRLVKMINITAKQGSKRPNTVGRLGHIFEYDFRNTIGTTSVGKDTSRLRVVVGDEGKVITAFPY